MLRALAAALAALFVLFAARVARADRVAVLPFVGVSNATSTLLDQARTATREAAVARGHTLPTDAQMVTAEMALKSGSTTTETYRAAGRAASADWTLLGRVEGHGASYRIELEACDVMSGRVESLAREIDPPKAKDQIAEMLALLLRPEGIADAEIPWDKAPTPPKPPAPTTTATPPPAPTTTTPPPPPPPPPVPHAYAEGHPIAVGLLTGVTTALHRAANAQGSSVAWLGGISFGYALDQVPGLELRADVRGALVGPGSFSADAGARWAFALAPTMRLYLAPEIGLGAFVALGGEKVARFLARGAAVGVLGLGERAQIELAPELAFAAGGSSSLLLGGATAGAMIRF